MFLGQNHRAHLQVLNNAAAIEAFLTIGRVCFSLSLSELLKKGGHNVSGSGQVKRRMFYQLR